MVSLSQFSLLALNYDWYVCSPCRSLRGQAWQVTQTSPFPRPKRSSRSTCAGRRSVSRSPGSVWPATEMPMASGGGHGTWTKQRICKPPAPIAGCFALRFSLHCQSFQFLQVWLFHLLDACLSAHFSFHYKVMLQLKMSVLFCMCSSSGLFVFTYQLQLAANYHTRRVLPCNRDHAFAIVTKLTH